MILQGMLVTGWIAQATTNEGLVTYGPFTTREQAESWNKYLTNSQVVPLYAPSFNRG